MTTRLILAYLCLWQISLKMQKLVHEGLLITGKSTGRKSFQLFDARKNFNFVTLEIAHVIIVKTYTRNPHNPFDPMYWPNPAAKPVDNAAHLARRLSALKLALETVPRQAIRLARWQAKREAMTRPKFTSALRSGRPPGYVTKPQLEIDLLLKECHALAWDVGYQNSS